MYFGVAKLRIRVKMPIPSAAVMSQHLVLFYAALILVSEPYYNEAGYQKQKGTQQGMENSRMYNEMAILKLTQVTGPCESTLALAFSTHTFSQKWDSLYHQ